MTKSWLVAIVNMTLYVKDKDPLSKLKTHLSMLDGEKDEVDEVKLLSMCKCAIPPVSDPALESWVR